jgi:hypothetical protein
MKRPTSPIMPDPERSERLQLSLSEDEAAAIEDFRFRERMPTRAAAVREILRRGLLATAGDQPENSN